MLDMVRWMLELRWPKRIASSGGILMDKNSKANITDTQTATFEFEQMPIVWQHRTWGEASDPEYPWAAKIYGDRGTLKVDVHRYAFTPAGKSEPTLTGKELIELDQYPEDKNEKDLEIFAVSAVRQHVRDFLRAVASRGRPVADIEEGHISTASCILANLSMKLGRSLAWDAEKQQVVGDEEANKLLRRSYRKPWEHPTLD